MRLDKLGKDKKGLKLDQTEEIDFESIFTDEATMHDDDWDDDAQLQKSQDDQMDDVMYQDYYYMDDDDEYEFMEDDAMDDIEIGEVRKNREKRDAMSEPEKREKQQQKMALKRTKLAKMKKQKKQEGKKHLDKLKEKKMKKESEMKQMNDGKAVEKTYMIEEEGWYRYCVDASYAPVRLHSCASIHVVSLLNTIITSLLELTPCLFVTCASINFLLLVFRRLKLNLTCAHLESLESQT